jgi:hypothetical protein
VHRHVDVLGDRGGDEKPAVLAIVRGEVGTSAAKGDTQRATSDDHGPASCQLGMGRASDGTVATAVIDGRRAIDIVQNREPC